MHTTPTPQIDGADLKAAREFLTGGQDRPRSADRKPRRAPAGDRAAVTVHHGIARARSRRAGARD